MNNRRLQTPLAIALLGASLLNVSCGGSGGGSESAPESTQFSSGDLAVRGLSLTAAQPVAGSVASIIGFAGHLTSASLRDLSPTMAESTIAYSLDQYHIMAMDGDGASIRELATGTWGIGSLDFNSTGSRIYFGDAGVKYVASTGGAVTQLATNAQRAALSPGGTLLVFTTPDNDPISYLKTISTSGTNPFLIGDVGSPNFGLDWLDNDWIVYGAGWILGKVKKDGTGKQTLTSAEEIGRAFPRVSPDKKSLVAITESIDGPGVEVFDLSGTEMESSGTLFPLDTPPLAVAWTPDSRELVILYEDGTIATLGLWGGSTTLYTQFKPASYLCGLDVAPPPTERLLVGTGGLFNTLAAGVLISQSGPRLFGAVAWDATTRSTSTLTYEKDASNDHTIVYRIEADAITKLAFTQNNSFKFVSALSAGAVNGAFVSFDGQTGRTVSVVCYNETRSDSRPRITRNGSTATIQGNSLSEFNCATGETKHNLSEVTLR
ncbi:MAG: hypothetical protein ACAH95_15070 [Fimbriimonas sp.]